MFILFISCVGNTEDQLDTESKLTTFLNKPTLIHVIPDSEESCGIMGITVLGHELFILEDQRRSLDVYNTISFTLTRNVEIPGSIDLQSIAACQHNNCLYISDGAQNIVFRCRFDHSENVISNWSVGGHCGGLSVTRSYSVLVTISNIHRVHEYTTDGSLIREIRLDKRIEYPIHCIQLSSVRFVVSYTQWERDLDRFPTDYVSYDQWETGECRVCIINGSGHIVPTSHGASHRLNIRPMMRSSIGESRRSYNRWRKILCNLAVDKHGHVMVFAEYNDRVELLSPTLTHLGYIQIPGYELDRPHALHLDELNHRLYIVERLGRIFVLGAEISDIS